MNTNQLIALWYGSFSLIVLLFLFYEGSDAALPVLWIISALIVTTLFYLTFRDSPQIDKKRVLKNSLLPISVVLVLIILVQITDELSRSPHYGRSIDLDEIEVFDSQLTIEDYSIDREKAAFKGRIRNNSERTLRRVTFRIRIYQFDYRPLEEIRKEVSKEIAEEDRPLIELNGKKFRETGLTLSVGYFNRNAYLPSVIGTFGEVGEQIDSEYFRMSFLLSPGETKSFIIDNSPTQLRPGSSWAWDYEIIFASSP